MHKARIFSQISSLLKRTVHTQEADVLFETVNNAGIITLNRPKDLNSLNASIVTKINHEIQEWENSRHLVIIKGTGDKAFSAGGNLKLLIDIKEARRFFYPEYKLCYLIGKYKIPYIAFLNGISMGAAASITLHGRYRVATEKTQFAIPETKIGIVPDVAGSYFFPRLQHNLGFYLGLTGDKLKGKDVVTVGIATHFVSSQRLNELEFFLSRCTSDSEVQKILNEFNEPFDDLSLAPNIKHINYCFAAPTVEEVIKRLDKVQNDWSMKTLETLHEVCPGSLKVTLRAFHRGAQLELPQCLKMDYCLINRTVESYNFHEGVRALLIDKDNKPQWIPKTLSEVDEDYVESYFKTLPQDRELDFLNIM